MAKHLVVLLLELDPDLLKEFGLSGKQFEELPHILAEKVKKIAPKAIKPTAVYYLTDKEKHKIEKVLDAHAMDFDEVVLSYHSKNKQAEAPVTCTVIKLDSYRPKQHKGVGKN